MKKCSILFLFIAQFVSAQNYDSYNSFADNDILKTIIIPLLIMIIVFTGIFFIISNIEGRNKEEDYSVKALNAEIWTILGVCIVIVSGLIWLLYGANINPYLVVLPVKIITAFSVSYFAKKKNRNSVLWWFLGFLEFHSALIVLALVKGLLPTKRSINDTDASYNEKLIKLNEMLKEKLINQSEFEKKKLDLEGEYRKKCYLIQQENTIQQNKDFTVKIENAFKEGLLTEEEYNSKISKNRNANDKIVKETSVAVTEEDEKEKFRKLHSDGIITFDELKEKFAQIENYHRSQNTH